MSSPHILINRMNFNLPNGQILFNQLDFIFSATKTGLVGKNGIGKSTLLKLILGEHPPHSGSIHINGQLAYLQQSMAPQLLSSTITIAGYLGCEAKLEALYRITEGSVDNDDFTILNDEWDIEAQINKHLAAFGLEHLAYQRQLGTLSGGEMTRLFLAQTFFSKADFLLLDEPTNHLDSNARQQLYQAIQQWRGGLIIVSHDRTLLNLMDNIVELNSNGATKYGGNYEYYAEQKGLHEAAQQQELMDAKKLIQKTKKTIQESHEKHDKKQSYGRELRRSGSIDKMGGDSKKGRSERTQSKLLTMSERLQHSAETALQSAKEKIEIKEAINIELPATYVPSGKILLEIEHLSFAYPDAPNRIIENINLQMQGAERIALAGDNGSGKTTLVKLIMGELKPLSGKIFIGTPYVSYLDQNASLLKAELSILENFMLLNPDSNENEAYRHLARFLFRNTAANKLVCHLSGGEKLRALLACVLMSKHPPQLLILDEPTNHLDLESVESIESALNHYQGGMIVISHDQIFLDNIGIGRIFSVY
ncbi:MAG: ABC-F family ATP-binding cassette domain-containing protein [Legionellales bacterium]|nr:ABC-F family ATP-binding cassette domain-containing protein [Legionellales bacterium]